jgi:hypothetical protein
VQGTSSAAKADLFTRLGDLGRPLKRGKPNPVSEGEAVFHIKAGKVAREVTDPKEVQRATSPLVMNKKGTKLKNATPAKSVGAGRYVVLNKDVVKRAVEGAAPTMQGPGIVHTVDKFTAGFKRSRSARSASTSATSSGTPTRRTSPVRAPDPREHGPRRPDPQSRREAGQGGAASDGGRPGAEDTQDRQVRDVSYDEVAKRLLAAGAGRSGYVGRELPELAKSGGSRLAG